MPLLYGTLPVVPAIDLHVHTTFSDGTFEPAETVRRAAELGLAGVGITDHDTTDGLPEAAQACATIGIDLVPGIELSAEFDGASIHVLAYRLDPANPEL